MEPLKPTFSCAFQDLPAIGAFVLQSAIRDQSLLATKSIKYKTPDFLDGYKTSLQAVNDLVNPAAFTAQHKKLTGQIQTNAKKIRPLLNNLDIRLDDAADLPATGAQLTVLPADFGIGKLRKAINADDAEGIIFHGNALLGLLRTNAEPLALVEYPAAEQAELVQLLSNLTTDNITQNNLISARDAKVQANLKVLNDFYDQYLRRVIADGKKAFKETDTAKTHDYTFARQKARVAAARKQEREAAQQQA